MEKKVRSEIGWTYYSNKQQVLITSFLQKNNIVHSVWNVQRHWLFYFHIFFQYWVGIHKLFLQKFQFKCVFFSDFWVILEVLEVFLFSFDCSKKIVLFFLARPYTQRFSFIAISARNLIVALENWWRGWSWILHIHSSSNLFVLENFIFASFVRTVLVWMRVTFCMNKSPFLF